MSKLKIRITNKNLLKSMPNGDIPALFNRNLRFGIQDDLELDELYDDASEFIGKMHSCGEGIFLFCIDRCETSNNKTGTLFELDANKKKDHKLYLLALEHDYHFSKDDYEIVS